METRGYSTTHDGALFGEVFVADLGRLRSAIEKAHEEGDAESLRALQRLHRDQRRALTQERRVAVSVADPVAKALRATASRFPQRVAEVVVLTCDPVLSAMASGRVVMARVTRSAIERWPKNAGAVEPLWIEHQRCEPPLAFWTEFYVRDDTLIGRLLVAPSTSPDTDDLLARLDADERLGFSAHFRGSSEPDADGVEVFNDIELPEISLTANGADDRAKVLTVGGRPAAWRAAVAEAETRARALAQRARVRALGIL